MLDELRRSVLAANLELPKRGLVQYTWGNVSGIDRASGLVVIKPSGVPYEELRAEHLVVVDLVGRVVEGSLRPSSDLQTHLVLYRAFPELGGVVHTHSLAATAWAQALRSVPCGGTTHADDFAGPIPCTRSLRPEQVGGDYESEIGKVIVETIGERSPLDVPAVLVASHGPFTWGRDPGEAVHNSVVLEQVCELAFRAALLRADAPQIDQDLLNRHFRRKHGAGAYYGQTAAPGVSGNGRTGGP